MIARKRSHGAGRSPTPQPHVPSKSQRAPRFQGSESSTGWGRGWAALKDQIPNRDRRQRRHHSQVRSSPWTTLGNGVKCHQNADGHSPPALTLAHRFYPRRRGTPRERLGSKDHQKQLRHLNYYRNHRRYGARATCVRRRVRSGNAPTLSPLPTRFYQCFGGYQMQPLVFFRQTLDIA